MKLPGMDWFVNEFGIQLYWSIRGWGYQLYQVINLTRILWTLGELHSLLNFNQLSSKYTVMMQVHLLVGCLRKPRVSIFTFCSGRAMETRNFDAMDAMDAMDSDIHQDEAPGRSIGSMIVTRFGWEKGHWAYGYRDRKGGGPRGWKGALRRSSHGANFFKLPTLLL